MTAVTLNADQRLFVLSHSGGYSCLGFDVVFKRLLQYARKLGLQQPEPAQVGTLQQYEQYRQAESAYIATHPSETLFDPDTPLQVQRILEQYRHSDASLRLFYGDAQTGRDWMEEHDVRGFIGRSSGPIHTPLLLARKTSSGGPAILTACIVRILDTRSHRELYRHPQYQAPNLRIERNLAPQGRPYVVYRDDEVHAAFATEAKALAWVEFMRGLRMKP